MALELFTNYVNVSNRFQYYDCFSLSLCVKIKWYSGILKYQTRWQRSRTSYTPKTPNNSTYTYYVHINQISYVSYLACYHKINYTTKKFKKISSDCFFIRYAVCSRMHMFTYWYETLTHYKCQVYIYYILIYKWTRNILGWISQITLRIDAGNWWMRMQLYTIQTR